MPCSCLKDKYSIRVKLEPELFEMIGRMTELSDSPLTRSDLIRLIIKDYFGKLIKEEKQVKKTIKELIEQSPQCQCRGKGACVVDDS